MPGDVEFGSTREELSHRLYLIRERAERAKTVRSVSQDALRLVGGRGYISLTTRLWREDLTFLTHAREDVLAFVEMAQHLLELHQPRESGALMSGDRARGRRLPRCRTCLWRWPCPTFRAIKDALTDQPDD